MLNWKDDDELIGLVKSDLFTAVIGDVMDVSGLPHQFLPPQIVPLRDDMLIVGRAMPVMEADCTGTVIVNENRNRPFGLMFEALDNLKRNEVYLCTGGSPTYALWGELMSERALQLGAAGAILNGYSRDTRGILRLNFPTFSWGRYAQDQGVRGRVIDFRCTIQFPNGALATPGDLIVADLDGAVVIPRIYEEDIVHKALEKVHGENKVREAIRNGMSAHDAFDHFGIM